MKSQEEGTAIHSGMNLREALRAAERMGCRVMPVRRTGEMRVLYPAIGSVRLNGRRTDAPRALTQLLKAVRNAPGASRAGQPAAADRCETVARDRGSREPSRERGVARGGSRKPKSRA